MKSKIIPIILIAVGAFVIFRILNKGKSTLPVTASVDKLTNPQQGSTISANTALFGKGEIP